MARPTPWIRRWLYVVLLAGVMVGACAQGVETSVPISDDGGRGSGGIDGSGGNEAATGGQGGGTSSTTASAGGARNDCGIDCSQIQTPPCSQAECDVTTKKCVVVSLPDNTVCDDGKFCTTTDTCQAGECVGGPENDCGLMAPACFEVICNESTKSCAQVAGNDGQACQDPNNLCLTGSSCQNGLCTGGVAKDCFFSPVPDECHVAECNPASGLCEPIAGNDGQACTDQSDLCVVGKTCQAGACIGGSAKDCSGLTAGCSLGVCDPQSGQCGSVAVSNGQFCDDLDACTTGETCSNQVCGGGMPVTQCVNNDYCCPAGCDENNDSDCASCDVNSALFPIAYNSSNSVGDITFDAQCNLYWSGDGGEVFRLAKGSTQVTTLHDFGTLARGVTFHPGDNKLYVGAQGNVYSMTTTGQNVQMISSIGNYVNGMEVAPSGWGGYGGQLIIAHHSGTVYRLPTTGGTAVAVGSTGGQLSDLVFDGLTLYVANYSSKVIQTLSPTGSFSSQATMPCNPDGIAVQENTELYVGCGSANTLYKVPLPNGTPVLIAQPMLNGGWAPAGLIFDGLDDIIVMEDGEFLKTYKP